MRRRTSDLRARNRAQRFEAIWRDGATRVQLTPKEEAARPFSREDRDARAKGQLARPADAVGLELRTVAVARGAERVQIPAGEFSVGSCRQDGAVDEMGECLRRAEARSSVLVEWWENRPDGLEQGFDLERAPLASDGQPLRLELRVEGADVRVDEDGQGATLTLPDGEELRYTGLLAKDARQSSLPILLSASGGGLSIEIQDRGATYPLHVDPLLATPLVYESNQDRHS